MLFYLKLPRWFIIDTPVGPYTPDWAVAYRDHKTLYFVAETKSTAGGGVNQSLLRPMERYKIQCGTRHFGRFEGVAFKAVEKLAELL